MKSMLICNGELLRRRRRSVSVVSLMGIRLSMAIFNGLMSCALARELSITNMFSFFNSSIAGSLSGIVNGIFVICFIFGRKINKNNWMAKKIAENFSQKFSAILIGGRVARTPLGYFNVFNALTSLSVAGTRLTAKPPPMTVLRVRADLLVTMPFLMVYFCGLVL